MVLSILIFKSLLDQALMFEILAFFYIETFQKASPFSALKSQKCQTNPFNVTRKSSIEKQIF